MTGLPITVGLSLLFSFQSLHAPCLSAEPDQNRTFRGEQKPTLIRVGRRRSLSLLRSYPSVPPRLSNRFRSLAGELYHLDSGCKPKTKDFSFPALLRSDSCSLPLGGSPLRFAEVVGVEYSSSASVGVKQREKNLSAGRRAWRSGVFRPEELCQGVLSMGGSASHL
jgi:hypothetical protein